MKADFSTKRLAIDKANATLIIAVGIATFITIFSLVACKTLITQGRYQAKVIHKQEQARDQLNKNVAAVEKLNTSYQEFANAPENVLGGNPKGSGDKDGSNPRIVLDALPSKYDFPALATSIEKMLKDNNYTLTNFTGTDDEVNQNASSASSSPQPIEVPFTADVAVSSQSAKALVNLLERSIRPIQVQKITITGQNAQLKMTISAKTFFQPQKNLEVKKETVK